MMIVEQMERLAAKRNKGTDTIVSQQIEWPEVMSLDDIVYLGAFSWFARNTRRRWIDADISINYLTFYPQTPGEVARDYLKIRYGQAQRIHRSQVDAVTEHVTPPLVAYPAYLDEAVYVDLKSAYWQIINAIGWDVDYAPGRWLGAGGQPEDFPLPGHKLARNMLVSSALPAARTIWAYDRFRLDRSYNPLINLQLWAATMHVLHGIAYDMLGVGAVYVHTDGYILPANKLHRAFGVASRWQVNLDVKYGPAPAIIYGAGRYTIGAHICPEGQRSRTMHHYVIEQDVEWLRQRYAAIAKARNVMELTGR